MREEIELAKTEIEVKVKKLARGAAVGAAAGFFVFLALIFAFHGTRVGHQRRRELAVARAS